MRTKPVSATQVRAYAAKALEFADASVSDLAAGRNIAATSLAIHAGINSADAVWGARLGKRAAGEDHDQVLDLLRQAGPDGAAVERRLVLWIAPRDGPFVRRSAGCSVQSDELSVTDYSQI
jgi:hypothetical protein